MVLPRSGLRLLTGQGGQGQGWSWLSVPKLSHIARGPCSFQSHQSLSHFHQLFTSPSFKWKKILPTSSSPCVAPLGAAFLLSSAQSPKQNSRYITPIVLFGGWSWIHVSEGYCNQEMILLISNNGTASATRKRLLLLPGCTEVWLKVLVFPGTQGEHPCQGDGDPTGIKAHEPRGSKVNQAGAKGEAGGAMPCALDMAWKAGVWDKIFDEAPTSVITLCLPLFLMLIDIRRGLDS